MRWLLIIVFLGADLLALFVIVKSPPNELYIDEGLKFDEEVVVNSKELNRIRRNLAYGKFILLYPK